VLRALALLVLIGASAAPAFAEGPADQQIYGLSLGGRAPDPSGTGGLQAAFGSAIANDLQGLMFVETGVPHYLLNLGDDRMLGIWFDGASKDRPIFWLDLTQVKGRSPATTPKYRPDFQITPRAGVPLGRVDIAIDPALPVARKEEIKADIAKYLAQHPPDDPKDERFTRFPTNDPAFRLELLGEHFRGQMISIYQAEAGKQRVETELFDAELARGVLSQQPQ
jgi:hypothetical protein